jgi:uncharacterized pyridoxal phosphate-containing UPF0001 family protein
VFGNGQSTIGENEIFDFKQKMAAMEENMAKSVDTHLLIILFIQRKLFSTSIVVLSNWC